MPIRLKVLRRQQERISKVKDLMEMFKVPSISYPTYGYQPIGASSSAIDPKIQKTKELFDMFHLER